MAVLITRRFHMALLVAVAVSALVSVSGVYASFYLDSAPAPTIVVLFAMVFIVTFVVTSVKARRRACDSRVMTCSPCCCQCREGGAFLKACQLTGQCQRERLVVELGNAGAVKTHPGLYLRKEGLKQALFGAEDQRQGEGERVSLAGKHRFFLCINDAVFDFRLRFRRGSFHNRCR